MVAAAPRTACMVVVVVPGGGGLARYRYPSSSKLRDRLGFLKHKRSAAAHTNRLPATSLSQPQSCKVLTARPTSSSCALSTLMQTHHHTQTQKSYAGTRLPSTTSSGPCVERGVKVARERESLAPPSGTVSFTAAWALATRDRRLHSAREKRENPDLPHRRPIHASSPQKRGGARTVSSSIVKPLVI